MNYFESQSTQFDQTKQYTLFFSHSLGGGTEHFTRRFIECESDILLVQNFSYYKEDFLFKIEEASTGKKVFVKPAILTTLLNTIYVRSVVLNSLVTNYSYKTIIQYICKLAKHGKIPVIYMLHDFHSVCPSVNLMFGEHYCNLGCKANCCSFNIFQHFTSESIDQWRETWMSLFSIITEIRAFSESSKKIFCSAYPDVSPRIVTVVPHDMSYFKFDPVNVSDFPLHIGIFGDCRTVFKGRKIVSVLAQLADQQNIQLFIIGPVRKKDKIKSKWVHYLGAYKKDQMREIIIKNKIKTVFFPSVCPETFSYLISELMVMEIPIVCFDIGAQAEKVLKYKNGKVAKIEDILDISTWV